MSRLAAAVVAVVVPTIVNMASSRAAATTLRSSADGRIVPKHSILRPILSAPLIAALGARGAGLQSDAVRGLAVADV
jgi:hypothetical protein